jgi:hypothetical protein
MDGNGNNSQSPSTTVTVTVTFDVTTRQVGFSAPINDEMVLLYMLDKATGAVKAHFAEQAKGQRILTATFVPPMMKH